MSLLYPLILGSLIFTFPLQAQSFGEGKLFTIEFSPGDRQLVVRAAGKAAMVLSSDRIVVFGKQISRDGEVTNLRIESSSKAFKILDQIHPSSKLEIEVEERATQKRELINIEKLR